MAEPRGLPSRKNWTEEMPAVEVAVAVSVVTPETVAPFDGAVRVTAMPVALMVRITGTVCGELEAAGSAIVAVAL